MTYDAFPADPWGWIGNQCGHALAGFLCLLVLIFGYYIVEGEMPMKVLAFFLLTLAYLCFEMLSQGWRAGDTVEDTVFFGVYGVGAPLWAVSEMTEGSLTLSVDMVALVPFLAAMVSHCAIGFGIRSCQLRQEGGKVLNDSPALEWSDPHMTIVTGASSSWVNRLWRQPMHSGEVVMGIILIGAGSASLIPGYAQSPTAYSYMLANGGQNAWAVARLIVGGALLFASVHDIVTMRRQRMALRMRGAALMCGAAMFAALATGFWVSGTLSGFGLYVGATFCALWAFGSVSSTIR